MRDVFDRMRDARRVADEDFEDAQYAAEHKASRMTAAPTGPEPRTDAAVGSQFWDDLRTDMADPEFREAYTAESARIAAIDAAAGRERDIRHDRTEGETT